MKCSNTTIKCKWVGTVGTLEAHVSTCEFTLLSCPNQCKDNKNKIIHFMRKDLGKHLNNDCPNRDHECEYCGEKGLYAHMTQVHENTCEMKIVPCPNADCTKTIQRRNAKRHIDECDYSEIPCKYQRLGCGVKIMRKDMTVHEKDDQLHLHIAFDKVINMEEIITTMKDHIQQDAIKVLTHGESITSKITDYQDKKNHNEHFISSTFYSNHYGYHMSVLMLANGDDGCSTHMSMYVHILKGEHDKELNWPFVGKFNIQILNQLEDKNHYKRLVTVTKGMNLMVGESRGYSKFVRHSALARDPVKNTQYLKDDTLYVRVSVDIPNNKPWLECTVK